MGERRSFNLNFDLYMKLYIIYQMDTISETVTNKRAFCGLRPTRNFMGPSLDFFQEVGKNWPQNVDSNGQMRKKIELYVAI